MQQFTNPLFRRASAFALICLSIMVLSGWALRIPTLVSLRAEWPVTAPLTAACFIISALVSFFLPWVTWRQLSLVRRIYLASMVLCLIAVSFLVLVNHILELKWPLYALMFADNIAAMHLESKASMAPATAFCFLLSALSFVFDFAKPKFHFFKMLSSVVAMGIGMIVLVSYAYGASILYEMPIFIRMSVVTSSLFVILHLGILFSDSKFRQQVRSPLEFWRDKNAVRERPLYLSLILVFMAFILVGIASSQSLSRLVQTLNMVLENQTALEDLDQLQLGLLNTESGQRGYLLTAKEDYLVPYYAGSTQVNQALLRLKKWMTGYPKYQEKFDRIEAEALLKLEELDKTIQLRKSAGYREALAVVMTDVGKNAMDNIRAQVTLIKSDLVEILATNKLENQNQVKKTVAGIGLGSFLATILLAVCLNLYVRNSLRRTESEAEVRRLNGSLEKKVQEVEVVNKELESFSYSVSHDLRAPLRAMSGFSNILLEDHLQSLDPQGQNYLKRIIVASEKMSKLIDGILDLSRISRHQVRREKVNLSDLAHQAIQEMQGLEPERKVRLYLEPGLFVQGDPVLLGSVVQNLIFNAWKFTSKTPDPQITFGVQMKGREKAYFVQDNGVGFDMAYSEKLFGTFQRLHTENEFKGTGIGLATVRRIIHLHGGQVWAEGELGKGATFYFTIG